jgi:hypothetical protein
MITILGGGSSLFSQLFRFNFLNNTMVTVYPLFRLALCSDLRSEIFSAILGFDSLYLFSKVLFT